MESSRGEDMREVRGPGTPVGGAVSYNKSFITDRLPIPVITSGSQLRMMVVFVLVGANVGISIASNLYRSLSVHLALKWTSTVIGVFALIQSVLLAAEMLRLRRVRADLAAERERILTEAKAELDELFPNQPVKVAGIMLHLQETILKIY
jgi:hypothetical protein